MSSIKPVPLAWVINSYPWPSNMPHIKTSYPIVTRVPEIQTAGSPQVIHRQSPDLTYKKV